MSSDVDSEEQVSETCRWCGEVRELVDRLGTSYLVVGPDGGVLSVPFGEVCKECWDTILEQWSSTGELSRPLTSYGGAPA